MNDASGPALDIFVQAAQGKKGFDLVVLDVHHLTSLADTFIICSGRSNRQVVAIADHIQQELKAYQLSPLAVEGKEKGHWVLLDYGYVVFHIFYEPIRAFYDLEGLWVDAERVITKSMKGDTAMETNDG